MLAFANAKINLGLFLTEKRADGYHNLQTVFYPIKINDVVELVDATHTQCVIKGMDIPGDVADNLCLKAFKTLQEDFNLPDQRIVLLKNIPIGAGLGGGSSDAAFLLKGLNDHFELGLTTGQLKGFAIQLGADCSFFIENLPAFATGIGEKLQPIDFSLKGYFLVLVKPPFGVGTKEAYGGIKPSIPLFPLINALQLPAEKWQDCMVNDFESSVFPLFPEIADIKSKLLDLGAVYAAMSGSGSSVFGLFKYKPNINEDTFPVDYFIWKQWISE